MTTKRPYGAVRADDGRTFAGSYARRTSRAPCCQQRTTPLLPCPTLRSDATSYTVAAHRGYLNWRYIISNNNRRRAATTQRCRHNILLASRAERAKHGTGISSRKAATNCVAQRTLLRPACAAHAPLRAAERACYLQALWMFCLVCLRRAHPGLCKRYSG